jgi:prepilin-type N-terminal cleavage/methylation domain-containing protein
MPNPKSHIPNPKSGFTLIELLVTLTIAGFLLTTLTSIFGVYILNSIKLNMEQKIKTEGTYALSQMQTLIRNAQSISNCSTSSVTVTDEDGVETVIAKEADDDGDQIIHTTSGNTSYLTSDYATMPDGEELEFGCFSDELGLRYVEISFTLKKGLSANPDKTTAIQQFNGGVVVRN